MNNETNNDMATNVDPDMHLLRQAIVSTLGFGTIGGLAIWAKLESFHLGWGLWSSFLIGGLATMTLMLTSALVRVCRRAWDRRRAERGEVVAEAPRLPRETRILVVE
ncbi:MAG: hypothetical protein WD042_09895 [Phycisphaeraceae bacterium]